MKHVQLSSVDLEYIEIDNKNGTRLKKQELDLKRREITESINSLVLIFLYVFLLSTLTYKQQLRQCVKLVYYLSNLLRVRENSQVIG